MIIVAIFVSCVIAQFQIEPWFANLAHYGPLTTEGWAARAMQLVDDYEYSISALSCNKGDQFMFVQVLQLNGAPAPPVRRVVGAVVWQADPKDSCRSWVV
jgi:hypothetical protein